MARTPRRDHLTLPELVEQGTGNGKYYYAARLLTAGHTPGHVARTAMLTPNQVAWIAHRIGVPLTGDLQLALDLRVRVTELATPQVSTNPSRAAIRTPP